MADMLATVLRYARPLHLKLGRIAGTMLRDANGGFVSMLRDESASNLSHLDLCIHFDEDDREQDLASIVVSTLPCLVLLALTNASCNTEQSVFSPQSPAPQVPGAQILHTRTRSNPGRT